MRAISTSFPAGLNAVIAAVCVNASLGICYLIPMLLPAHPWAGLLLIPCILTTTTNWSLIHEAVHGQFNPDPRINQAFGRLAGILFGAPFETLRYGHLLHHTINGTLPDRPEYADLDAPWWKRALLFYPRLCFGLYLTELLASLACLLPRSVLVRATSIFPGEDGAVRAERYLLKPERLREIRIDGALALLLLGGAFWSYGTYWPLLVLALVVRGFLISVADNGYHYGAPVGRSVRAAYNLHLSFGALILNFNLHEVHHRNPTLPWIALPDAFVADRDHYDDGYFSMMGRQFKGPLALCHVSNEKTRTEPGL